MLLLSLGVNVKMASCQISLISVMFGLLMFFFVGLAYLYFMKNLFEVISGDDGEQSQSSVVTIIIVISMAIVIFS